jgi:hypothetical protein
MGMSPAQPPLPPNFHRGPLNEIRWTIKKRFLRGDLHKVYYMLDLDENKKEKIIQWCTDNNIKMSYGYYNSLFYCHLTIEFKNIENATAFKLTWC